MGNDYGGLVFVEDNDPPKGFTNTDANRDQIKDQIVIRELLQNALDSGAEHRNVRFVLQDVHRSDIFGLDEYQRAFNGACSYLEHDEPPTGQQTIKRVKKALSRKALCCLFCCDDGDGIGEKELRSVYGSGRSTKRSSGRGSVGHGHLTAFVPSDLRYVLYAGRRAAGDGAYTETFGGHAIVATHIITTNSGQSQRSADGFIRQKRNSAPSVPFDSERGGTAIPAALSEQMLTGTGSVVMITAYKPVSATIKPVGLILPAAARHFLVAIYDGTLNVTFTDVDGSEHALSRRALQEQVKAISPTRHRMAAERTLGTLQDPDSRIPDKQVEDALGPGARVWIRPQLRNEENASHRVSVFRDGMWIQDNTVNYLQPRHFAGVKPFDAVIDLKSDHPQGMGRLVRDAEGASHLQITPNELENPSELVARLAALRSLLTAHAQEGTASEPYAPPQLRLTGSAISSAMPKRRPKRPEPQDDNHDQLEQERATAGDGLRPSEPPDRPARPDSEKTDTEKTDQTVKPGNSSGLSTSCRPDTDDPCVFHVNWKASGRGFRSGAADLSLALPSGTDQTSRHRIAPAYLTIVAVQKQRTRINVPQGGSKQVRIPSPGPTDYARIRVTSADADQIGPDRSLVQAVLFHRVSTTSGKGHS